MRATLPHSFAPFSCIVKNSYKTLLSRNSIRTFRVMETCEKVDVTREGSKYTEVKKNVGQQVCDSAGSCNRCRLFRGLRFVSVLPPRRAARNLPRKEKLNFFPFFCRAVLSRRKESSPKNGNSPMKRYKRPMSERIQLSLIDSKLSHLAMLSSLSSAGNNF